MKEKNPVSTYFQVCEGNLKQKTNKEKFAERIRKAADLIGGQAELSRRTGITKVTIGTYTSGKSDPSRERLIAIAEATDVFLLWLATGEGPMRPGQPDQRKVYHPGDYGYVPMAEAQLSAGDGAFVTTENIRDYYAFRTDWLCRTATSVKNAILMSVIGNSMEPTIHEGDIVMLDTGRTHIYDGKIYALRMEDTIMIKRLSLRPGDRIQVISDNKTEYDPYESDRDDIHVLAQVVWFARALVRPE